MSSLRERVAQAMFEADERSRETVAKISRMAWSEVGDQYRANWLERADAAIAAIEASGTHVVVPVEPTEAMVKSAIAEAITVEGIYRAMLAARPLDVSPMDRLDRDSGVSGDDD